MKQIWTTHDFTELKSNNHLLFTDSAVIMTCVGFYLVFSCLCVKGILSITIVIFSYPKLLSFSVLTFIKWRLTPSYAVKDTIFWQKRPKTIIIGIIVQDNKNSNLFIWPSMWTRLEHAHCLETINNMWFLGKRESVNAWKKVDFDGFREKDE